MKKYKKLHVFLITAAFGAVVTCRPVLMYGFTEDNIRSWILNALTVTAVVGVVIVKYLRSKGQI